MPRLQQIDRRRGRRRALPSVLGFATAIAVTAAAAAVAASETPGSERPESGAAPSALLGEITVASLETSERYWPYRTALVAPWDDGGSLAEPLRPGLVGVLIRVEQGGRARVDFGRDGLFVLPVAVTDLVERSEKIRRGVLEKTTPNFVHAIAARLADPNMTPVAGFPSRRVAEHELFLCVYFDATSERGELDQLAATVSQATRDDPGLLPILFPIGALGDEAMATRLREVGLLYPFVINHLSESYAATLVPEGSPQPYFQVTTAEGRVVREAGWNPGDPMPVHR